MERIPIQLVVCDIDDTLIHKDDHLKEETIQVIQELKMRGIQFTLATGRMPYRAESYARDAELTIPYVANNGSILYDRGRMIWCRMLYAKIIQEITQRYMEMYPQFTVIFSFTDRECPLVRTEWIRKRLGKYKGYDQTLGNTPEVWNQAVHKIYVLDDARSGMIGAFARELERCANEISFFQYGEVITRKMMLSDILPEVLQLLMENKTQECMELVRSQTIAEKNEISREETELFKVQALEFILQLRAEVENLAGENEIRWNSRIFTQDFGKMSCADEVLKWTETHIEELGNVLTEKPYEESEYIRKVLHYIKGNFSKDLSLEDAGKEIGISSFYLSRLLKQERKTTFIETLTDIRLEAAVRMMKEGQLPMKEICCRSGYPNQSYFYRVVKKTTGMTVGVLRRYL